MNKKPTEQEIMDYCHARNTASFWWRKADIDFRRRNTLTNRAIFYDNIANEIGYRYDGAALDALLMAIVAELRRGRGGSAEMRA